MQQLVCGFGYTEAQSVHRQRELARKLFHESAEASLELPDAVGRIVGVENTGNAVAGVFVVSLLLSLLLPKKKQAN